MAELELLTEDGDVLVTESSQILADRVQLPKKARVKPRYTPDPLPVDMDPKVREWFQRQIDRIHDLWPKDLERRMAQLEALQEARSGRWPIVDSSFVNFGFAGELVVYQSCAPAGITYVKTHNHGGVSNAYSGLKFSEDGTKLVAFRPTLLDQGWYEYSASIPFDVGSLSFVRSHAVSGDIFESSSNLSTPMMTVDGLNFYVAQTYGSGTGKVYQWKTTGEMDLSTMYYFGQVNVTTRNPSVIAADISRDGSKLFLMNNNNDRTIHVYNLASPGDITTAAWAGARYMPELPSPFYYVNWLRFQRDGSHLFIGTGDTKIRVLAFSDPFNIWSASFLRDLSTTNGNAHDVYTDKNCEHFIVEDIGADQFDQYVIT